MAFKINWHWLILGLAGIIFFLSSLVLTFNLDLFSSPDETANLFFAKRFLTDSTLTKTIPLNIVLDDTLFPRSTFSRHSLLFPTGFVGLPVLYGFMGKIIGEHFMLFLTPLLAVLAVCAWYGFVKVWWNARVALLAALLLFFHPAFWFYSARTMMHNVFFVCLILFSVWFLTTHPVSRLFLFFKKKQTIFFDLVISGFCLGLSLFVRTAEAPWILFAVLFSIIFFRKKIFFKPFLVFFLSFCVALLPIGFFNGYLYGNPFVSGYEAQQQQEIISNVFQIASSATIQQKSFFSFLPFHFDLANAFRNGFFYGLALVWWMSILTIIGLGYSVWNLFLQKKHQVTFRSAQTFFLIFFLCVGVWLLFFYGSWVLYDNPDKTQITLANSYMRYWLPVFVMTTVFAALGMEKIFQRYSYRMRCLGLTVMLLFFFLLSVQGVFFHEQDGLLVMREKTLFFERVRDDVLKRTEPQAVIVVDRADKIFFPYRLVRYPLRSEDTYQLLPKILESVPLYYYGITFPPKDMEYLNTKKLLDLGLQIEHVQTYGQESLYRIEKFSPL